MSVIGFVCHWLCVSGDVPDLRRDGGQLPVPGLQPRVLHLGQQLRLRGLQPRLLHLEVVPAGQLVDVRLVDGRRVLPRRGGVRERDGRLQLQPGLRRQRGHRRAHHRLDPAVRLARHDHHHPVRISGGPRRRHHGGACVATCGCPPPPPDRPMSTHCVSNRVQIWDRSPCFFPQSALPSKRQGSLSDCLTRMQ